MSVANGAFTRTEGFSNVKDTCRPIFSEVPVQTGEVEGRKTYKMVERVQVYMPGNGLNSPVFNVTDEHKERWPREYEAFKQGAEVALNGTPLEEWAILNKAMVLELKSMHILTIEDVAGLPDTAVQRIGRGGYHLRERALAFLDQAKEQELVTRLTAKDEKNSEEISLLRRQVEEMGAMLESLSQKAHDAGDSQSALSTLIPAAMDVNERMKPVLAPQPEAGSSFDNLAPIKRKPGRPKKDAA